MITLFRYRTMNLRARSTTRMGMQLESLENRIVLSANPPFDLDSGLGGLAIDPSSYEPDSIIVRYRDAATCAGLSCNSAQGHAAILGTQIARAFDSVPGLHKIGLTGGLSVDQAIAAYRTDPNVLYAEPNYIFHTTQLPDDPRFSELWGLNNLGQTGGAIDRDIDAPEAWDVTTGGSTLVAVIDTGVDYNHVDLAANMWVNVGEIPGDGIDNDLNGFVDDVHGFDFANNDGDPMDDQGHGTHVAGTVGAVGNNGIGVTGVNWNVEIMAVKFLDATGNGTAEQAIDAINYAVAQGAVISNNSWGGNEPFSQGMYDAIAAAGAAGHIFVAGAGNGNVFGVGQNNDTNPFYPASFDLDNIIAVAATDHTDARAGFSNYGIIDVDLAAPGVDILSTTRNDTYGLLSGTSMATPHVTGVVSLVRQQNPGWSYTEVINQVLGTVDPIPSMQGITVTGGRLNASAALGNPAPPPPPPPPGTLPIFEGYGDGVADFFDVQSGTWDVSSGRYNVTPTVDDPDVSAISTLRVDSALPSDLDVRATVNANPEPTGILSLFFNYLSNAYVVFDYQSETDFKFAGADVSGGRWLFGERTTSGWQVIDSLSDANIAASTNYDLRLVVLDDTDAVLHANGAPVLSRDFTESVTDGKVGVGVRNSVSHFDNVQVSAYVPPPPPGNLPIQEDFSDGVADHFETRTFGWSVGGGAYHAAPSEGSDAISTIRLADPLPSEVELGATINVDLETGSYFSDALLIFDYYSNVNFKFAGAYARSDRWVIGHHDGSTWVTDVMLSETIDAGRDYDLEVLFADDGSVSLTVDGLSKVSHNFGESLTDGEVGVGTWNAVSHFDNVTVQQHLPPPPPSPGTLPIVEDFSDDVADFFEPQVGGWNVGGGRYHATPVAGGDTISTFLVGDPLPPDLDIRATVNAEYETSSLFSDALIIFDYQGPTDFKFAGAYVRADKWVIGHRTSSTWVTDVFAVETIAALTDYSLQVVIENDADVTLYVDGAAKLSHGFADSLSDGDAGIGTWNGVSHFDDVSLKQFVTPPPPPPPPSGSLPIQEDFSDGVADFFEEHAGSWNLSGGQYHATPIAGGDAISTVRVDQPLPSDLDLRATINANLESGSLFSDAVIVFDYQGPTDFKFAGAYVRADKWVIGHRTSSTWITDASFLETIDAATDYQLQVVIENDSQVTLYVDGAARLSHSFTDSLSDGDVGVGTWNAISRFDDISVQQFVPPPPPPSGSLPIVEDFSDGIADFFETQVGGWSVSGGRYHATPVAGGDTISTLRVDQPLPADMDIRATVNADLESGSWFSDALIVFDYQGPTDFKFAGAYAKADKWVIGHRSSSTWVTDASLVETISAGADYQLQVIIEGNGAATLVVGGEQKVAHNFGGSLTDGDVGVGTWNAISHFDDIAVQQYVPPPPPAPGNVLFEEDFSDGVADSFQARVGNWSVGGERYHATPSGDAISTFTVGSALPADFEVQAVINADLESGSLYSDAVVIFDYQSPTNFKFAGAYVRADKWVIGHRTSSTWVTDASLVQPIEAAQDYQLRVAIEGNNQVTLFADDDSKVTYTFSDSVTDGELGVGTWNAISHFDDVLVRELVSGGIGAASAPAAPDVGGSSATVASNNLPALQNQSLLDAPGNPVGIDAQDWIDVRRLLPQVHGGLLRAPQAQAGEQILFAADDLSPSERARAVDAILGVDDPWEELASSSA